MTNHEAMVAESRRVGWPIIFRSDLALDRLEQSLRPERFEGGFGWLLAETCTHIVARAPGAEAVIDELAAAYPLGRWYHVKDAALHRVTPRVLARRLAQARAAAA